MQKDMLEMREALERTVKYHKDSVKKARGVESKINVSCIYESVIFFL